MRPNPQLTADLVLFNEEIVDGKLHFLCSLYFKDTWSFCVKFLEHLSFETL